MFLRFPAIVTAVFTTLSLFCLPMDLQAQARERSVIVVFKPQSQLTEHVFIRRAKGVARRVLRHRLGLSERAIVQGAGGAVDRTFHIIPAMKVKIPERAINRLRNNPRIAYIADDAQVMAIEPEVVSAQATPEEYANSWGVQRIGSEIPHSLNFTGSGVRIGVIDSGINYNHIDLAANYFGGTNIIYNTTDPFDDTTNKHGSHVSGIIAGIDNGTGVVGVAPEAMLYAVKSLDGAGFGTVGNIIDGVQWAVDNGMDIVNMSVGLGVFNQALQDVCDAADNAGLLLVAAAGNSFGQALFYPALFPSVMAVTATTSIDVIAGMSPRGPEVELSAPGTAIYSTTSTTTTDNYGFLSGTSQAAPHAAGTAALLLSAGIADSNGNGRVNDEVRTILQNTAEDLGDAGRDDVFGFGLVDAEAAILEALALQTSMPPARQNIGMPDTVFDQMAEADCRFCHRNDGTAPDGVPVNITQLNHRHHNLIGTVVPPDTIAPNPADPEGNYECFTCHTAVWNDVLGAIQFEPFNDCTQCHVQTGSLTVHHATDLAQGGACAACHGYIVDPTTPPDQRSEIRTYPGSSVTPWPSDKPDGALADPADPTLVQGMAGNCDYCHNNQENTLPDFIGGILDPVSGINIYRNEDTHHSTGFGDDPTKCTWCHYATPPTDTRLQPLIRPCQTCHDVSTLHNIQVDSDGDGEVNPGTETAYYGHIGDQNDCWGCHAGVSPMAAPESGPTIPTIHSINATASLIEGQTVTLIISGASLTNNILNPATGAYDITFTSDLAITDDSGNTTVLEPNSLTESTMEVDVTLGAGNYRIAAVKGRHRSNTMVITVADAVSSLYAICRGTAVTVKGEGFSMYVDVVNSGTGITAVDRAGTPVDCQVESWTDNIILSTCSACPSTVTVDSIWGATVKRTRIITRPR